MGGVVGHILHLHDNLDLTFGEIKEVLSLAAEGKLEHVTEKIDGLNVVFTFSPGAGVRVARSGGDIQRSGMSAQELATKFAGRGNLTDAFNGAFKVLNDAVSSLSSDVALKVFKNGRVWYSAEVIYSANPNVINYDNNWIVFHASPTFEVTRSGQVNRRDDAPGIKILERHVDSMQKALTLRSWRVRGPALVQMKRVSDGSIVQQAINGLDKAQSTAGVGDDSTLREYLISLLHDEVMSLGVSPQASKAIVERCLGEPGSPTLPDIKKMVTANDYLTVAQFVKASPALLKKMMAPIELAIHHFAVQLLKGLQSTLVGNSDKEALRLRQELGSAVKAIEASGDTRAIDILHTQLQKLGQLEAVYVAMEGVVFQWKGKTYKFTADFSAVNQILGLFKYGRARTKVTNEAYLCRMIDPVLINDGKRQW